MSAMHCVSAALPDRHRAMCSVTGVILSVQRLEMKDLKAPTRIDYSHQWVWRGRAKRFVPGTRPRVRPDHDSVGVLASDESGLEMMVVDEDCTVGRQEGRPSLGEAVR